MAVGGPERVAEMVASLQVGSHAADPPAPDHAVATEALGRVLTPGVPAQVLPAVAVLVEDHGMQVDLPAAPVDQDQPSRQAGHDRPVVAESHPGRGRLRRLQS